MTSAEARLEELFIANYGDVLAYAVRRCASRQDAEDVVAETFAVAWRRIQEVPEGERTRLWLFGTARLVRLNHQRSHHRQQGLLSRMRGFRTPMPSSGDPQMQEHAWQRRVEEALAVLSPADREAIQLHIWEQLSAEEIATTLETSVPAVWKRLQRARDRLAAELTSPGDAGAGSLFSLDHAHGKAAQ